MAAITAGFACSLAERFLPLFVVGMPPVLLLLALIAHWLP
jgi:hypothetical protein